jgi:uncharacterized cofD-like protein
MLRAEVERSIASIAPGRFRGLRDRVPARRLVALGGGTGLPVVLRGLRKALFPVRSRRAASLERERLTAIVNVADDGGSSGRLRRAYGVLPPGDIRNCLVALADEGSALSPVFDFRFEGNGGLGGHSLGNLILTALSRMEEDFSVAVERAAGLLASRGRVFPATLQDVSLLARFADGSRVAGESRIAAVRRAVRRLSLVPPKVRALPQALEAVERADRIVIGPGSLYTSLIPILLVEDLVEAVARSRARVVLVMNLMTEPGETDGYSAADVVLALRRHAPGLPIDDVLIHDTPIPRYLAARYAESGAVPIKADPRLIRSLGCRPIGRDLLRRGTKVRHDPVKLARAILGTTAPAGGRA